MVKAEVLNDVIEKRFYFGFRTDFFFVLLASSLPPSSSEADPEELADPPPVLSILSTGGLISEAVQNERDRNR